MNKECLVLIAHGSRNPGWREPFEALLLELRREMGPQRVALAFMESCTPTLSEVMRDLADRGEQRVRILPIFFSNGNHLEVDIPEAVDKLKAQYPHIAIEVMPPIGRSPRFVAMMLDLVHDLLPSEEISLCNVPVNGPIILPPQPL